MKNAPLIYIVDDSEIVRETLRFGLDRKLQCNIELFANAESVLEAIQKKHPEVLILDHHLDRFGKHNMTGLQLLQFLYGINTNVPTIVFSGQQELENAIDYLRNGACGYVDKKDPDFFEDLVAQTQSIIDVQYNEVKLAQLQSERSKRVRSFFAVSALFLLSLTYGILASL